MPACGGSPSIDRLDHMCCPCAQRFPVVNTVLIASFSFTPVLMLYRGIAANLRIGQFLMIAVDDLIETIELISKFVSWSNHYDKHRLLPAELILPISSTIFIPNLRRDITTRVVNRWIRPGEMGKTVSIKYSEKKKKTSDV